MRCPFRKKTTTVMFPQYLVEMPEYMKGKEIKEDFEECYEDECPYYRVGRCYKIFIGGDE